MLSGSATRATGDSTQPVMFLYESMQKLPFVTICEGNPLSYL